MKVKSGENNTKTISERVKIFIAEKVKDQKNTITPYVELQLLIEQGLEEKHFTDLYNKSQNQAQSRKEITS